MPKLENVKKVLVIGSGPIIIGQAAEFDYSGTQACRSLREEGLKVVLVNSNPATIMTDTHIADRVYVEPLNVEFLESVIRKEHPDAMLATLGGQVGLNLAMELEEKGILRNYNVKLLGTQIETIKRAEDRELFKEAMQKIHQPIPESTIVETVLAAKEFAHQVGYPLIVRPAYTLGGTGGGIAHNDEELDDIVNKGLTYSLIGQALIERSIAGWKEIEYEVLRDADDNCITVCNMENVDPVGIHTGDSVVVAPCQTCCARRPSTSCANWACAAPATSSWAWIPIRTTTMSSKSIPVSAVRPPWLPKRRAIPSPKWPPRLRQVTRWMKSRMP